MRGSSAENTLLVPVLATGAALLALMWFAVIGPKRADSNEASSQLSSQEARLKTARQQVADYTASRKRFPGMLAELHRLDIAVPARAEISNLLREVQRGARLRGSDLRLATLKVAGGAAGAAKPSVVGASPGPGGMSALPFTFSYTGRYFQLLKVVRAVRRAVDVRAGDLQIRGRLLTIDGVAFRRARAQSPLTKVVFTATAYIAADPTQPSTGGTDAPGTAGSADAAGTPDGSDAAAKPTTGADGAAAGAP